MKASGSGGCRGISRSPQARRASRIAVRILAGRQRLRLSSPLAAGDVGEQLEQHVGRRRQRHAVSQHLAQRAAADRKIRRRIERLDDGVDQRRIVCRKEPERIADRVVESAFRQDRTRDARFPFREPGLLSRVRERNVASTGLSRDGRRTAWGCWRRRSRRRMPAVRRPARSRFPRYSVLSMRAVSLPPGTHRFSRSSLPETDRTGIVLAVVAALAAILLRHRRHHAPAQRPAFGKLHALGHRQGLVVPGRFRHHRHRSCRPRVPEISAAACSPESGVTPSRRATPARQKSR